MHSLRARDGAVHCLVRSRGNRPGGRDREKLNIRRGLVNLYRPTSSFEGKGPSAVTPLVHLPPDCSHEAVCESLDQDAAVVIDGLLDEAALEAVDRELSPFFETARRGTNDFSGFETQRLGALMARSATCRDMALDRLVNGACRQYLLRHADGYQLHFTQAVRIGPGEGAQPLHRDRGVWGERVPRRIETQLSTVWAISGFTRANGATRVVPGSHRWEKERQPEEHEVVDAEMEPGSVLVYSGTVLHGGGNNTSDSHY